MLRSLLATYVFTTYYRYLLLGCVLYYGLDGGVHCNSDDKALVALSVCGLFRWIILTVTGTFMYSERVRGCRDHCCAQHLKTMSFWSQWV